MKPLIVPLFSNPESNGLQSAFCTVHQFIHEGSTRHEHIHFFFYKIILVLGNQGSIIENVIHPFNLKTLNCDQNTYGPYLKF